MTFADREDAGRRLAQALSDFRDHDVVVLGLPRGGVPVAAVVARALGAPLDVIVVRKLGVPAAPELAMGAIGERGVRVLNELVLCDWNLSERDVERVEARERVELERRVRRFRGERSSLSLAGRTVIVVDDGVATGATARAACLVARELGARRVLLAVPVASSHAVSALEEVADQVVCLREPLWFRAVGEVYEDFAQVSDDEVKSLLDSSPHLAADTRDVGVRTAGSVLPGALVLPQGAGSVVVFAHGSGSSRNSPRNQYVARRLNQAGLGTLLFDLLTSRESEDLALVFDVELLGGRLLGATQWLRAETTLPDGAVGYRRPLGRRRSGGLTRRSPGHRGRAPAVGHGADSAHRGRSGPRRPRPEPAGEGPHAGRRGDRRRPRGGSSVRGTGSAGPGRRSRR
jgi:putative phosphoribosyl transferase